MDVADSQNSAYVDSGESSEWTSSSLKAMFMGPTWGPSGADRTQVGPMLNPWTLLSGLDKAPTCKGAAINTAPVSTK